MRCTINFAGTTATDIANDQLNRSTNREIGAVALSKNIHAAVHTNRTRAWSVAHDDWTNWHRGCENAVNVERVIAHCFKTSNDPGQVLGFASRHDRIDGGLLDSHRDLPVFDVGERVVGRQAAGFQHRLDAIGGRRYDGQSVGPAIRVAQLDGAGDVGRHVSASGKFH